MGWEDPRDGVLAAPDTGELRDRKLLGVIPEGGDAQAKSYGNSLAAVIDVLADGTEKPHSNTVEIQ